jgi:branched-chain amino acid transport system permease protein
MDLDIALLLTVDGVANGAIYVLIALGTVLIFSVTRVIFVPFGDIAAFTALTLASIQMGRLPGTVWLVSMLAVIAVAMEMVTLWRRSTFAEAPAALIGYGVLSMLPVALAVLTDGIKLPLGLQMLLALALILPIAPLLDRIAFRPLADASVLVLLIVAVAVHFAISGLALLFFGPEGFRTEPISRALFEIGGVTVSAQVMLMVAAAIVFSAALFLYFEHTIAGKALRATAVNRVGARIVGIRPQRTGTIAYILASLLGGISGLLIGPVATLYYDSGFLIGLKAFVGAIIGGLMSYPLTALGAILVGILESFASFWSSTLKEVIVFATLIPILLWRSLLSGTPHEEEEEEIT